jgi:hypothetical protein
LARRANKHVFASFFAVFALLSERKRTGGEKKSLNHEDHEGHEEKLFFVGPEGQ